MKTAYSVGQVVRLDLSITDVSGAARDPDAITYELASPSGISTSLSWPASDQIVHDGLGLFHVLLPIAEYGLEPYRFRFTSTGGTVDVPDVVEDFIAVKKPLF